MADFQTHITTSTIIGLGYGIAGYFGMGLPVQTCALAAGLCGASGMLPDLDSDSGVPVRETTTLAAAIAPMLMMERFGRLGWSHETMTVAGGAMYLVIRFGVAEIFKRYTVHRGMWHSLPAAAVAGLLAYLVCSCDDGVLRWYKALAVVTGFLSHLVLDELWSIDILMGRLRFKKSFGTAIKLWGDSWWANLSTYAKLMALSALAFYDPLLMDNLDQRRLQAERIAQELLEKSEREAQQLWPQPQENPPHVLR